MTRRQISIAGKRARLQIAAILGATIALGALPGKAALVFFTHLAKLGNQSQLPIPNRIVTHDVLAAFTGEKRLLDVMGNS
jgi:hypothetical protein